MRAGSARAHGADVYDDRGRPRRLLDFSSTVAGLAPPPGWREQVRRAAGRLALYPQPRSRGLAQHIERRLGLPEGSVLVGNGSMECLDWLARAAAGAEVLVEAPFFGEVPALLHSAGARSLALFHPRPPQRPDLARALGRVRGGWAWLADPVNPTGAALDAVELAALLDQARRLKVSLVIDEALACQQLAPRPELAPLAASRPGLYVVRSISKGLGLPGLRLGYVVAHPRSMGALLPYTRPWSVNALAQGLGAWAFDAEAAGAPRLRRQLAARKADLLERLRPLGALGFTPQASDTGCFLLALPRRGPTAEAVAGALEARGLLLRSCHSYGKWGARLLRLNPRGAADNLRLARALQALAGKRAR